MTLILTRSELTALAGQVGPARVVDAVESALRDAAAGKAHQPGLLAARSSTGDQQFLPMTAAWDASGLAGVKLLADIPSNAGRSLPTQRSVLVLVDATTGEPVAVLDGAVPTRVRTAATSAVATRHLAVRPWSVLGLIGAGALAVEHVRAHLVDQAPSEVVVWSRSERTTTAFTAAVATFAPDLKIVVADSPRGVVERADVVCSLTPSREPLLEGAWARSGQHFNVVGAPPRPDHREADGALLAQSRVVVDSLHAAEHESGEIVLARAEGSLALDHPLVELGSVIADPTLGRAADDQVTVFDSVGIGIEDVAVGHLLVAAAEEAGMGRRVRLDA